ncbi:hypothetical protein KDK95_01410 [Actinospica sp. MGRD01-02]|uniref:Uncharacterized protein n=1 Tax=Actinospica acidithermotolerans TaxID=2828514 RepID=A0A941E6Z3_9ACTN|nr:hypothetical protein [Actinospica acidithermotolerans]MBR7824947.1 hypothetical protein [Actinospica acidithermotolerans]
MSTALAALLENLELVHGDLAKVIGLIEAEQVPVYNLETVLLAVSSLAAQVRDRALEACAEAVRVCDGARPEGATSQEAARRYINTLITSQLLAGGAG